MIMPEKDGIETLQEILRIGPEARVFTFSGRLGAGEHNGTAAVLGVLRTFEKPFRVDGLLEAISACLENSLSAV